MAMDLRIEKEFTKVFKEYYDAPRAIREIKCLEVLYPALCPPIEKGDLFAGRALLMEWRSLGFTPDVTLYSLPHGMGYFYRADTFQKALDEASTPEEKAEIQEMMAFWEKENTTAHVKSKYTPRIRQYLPSDSFAGDVGVGFPLYRMTGAFENYELLLSQGLDGLKARIAEKQSQGDPDRFYEALSMTCDLIARCALHYSAQAEAMAKEAADSGEAAELTAMAADLRSVAGGKPQTFRQAIQLSWLYSCLAGVMDYGRMDMYLGDYLADDLAAGRLNEEEAQRLVVGLWRLIVARKTVYHGRVVIGGTGRPHVENADRFAMMAMEASRIVKDIEPQLTLRVYQGMDRRLWDKAMEVIGSGATYPMIYNDDVNVSAVMNAFKLDRELADQYVPFGCGEYIIDHKSFGSPNGVINMLKALEVTLFNGQDIVKGQQMGLVQKDFAQYESFSEFYGAYKRQLTHYIEVLAEAEAIILEETGNQAPFLMMSLLYDGCIEKGKSMLLGGLDYLGATLESYGNINTVDSLVAIRDLVFEEKKIAPERLLEALRANFEGYEAERKLMLAAPKYGNDLDTVDDLAWDLHDFEARVIRDQADRVGLHSFLMVVINNSANTYLGRWTGASADGRKALTFMANANNPVGGMDKNGITAMLNSLAKFPPENHAGSVQNVKFSRELFDKSPKKASALLEAYFENGGTQAMVTVVGRKDLEEAMAHPEHYGSLLVRVGGFSARFVELEEDVKQEVLSRTAY